MWPRHSAISLCASLTSLGLCAISAQAAELAEPGSAAPAASPWKQVSIPGLEAIADAAPGPLVVFHQVLYLAFSAATSGCGLWRSRDGTRWEPVVGAGAHTPQGFGAPGNERITTLLSFDDWLYAGTQNPSRAAELWASSNGVDWEAVIGGDSPNANGFGGETNTCITALAGFQQLIFAGAGHHQAKGAGELWISADGALTWDPSPQTPNVFSAAVGRRGTAVQGFVSFRDQLYAAVGGAGRSVEVWRTSDGQRWIPLVGASTKTGASFGGQDVDTFIDFAVFQEHLYAVVTNAAHTDSALWHTGDGTTWELLAVGPNPPTGDEAGGHPELGPLAVLDDRVYVAINRSGGAMELWGTADGQTWDRFVGPAAHTIKALAAFQGAVYAATLTAGSGLELWRFDPPPSSSAG